MRFIRHISLRGDILELDVILVEVLHDTDVVVLHLGPVGLLSWHRADAGCRRNLGPVEASRIRFCHIVDDLAFQILLVADLVRRRLLGVDAAAEGLQPHPRRVLLLRVRVLLGSIRRWRLVVGLHVTGRILRVLISVCSLHVLLHILAHGRAARLLVRQDTRQLTAVSRGDPVRVYLLRVLSRTERGSVLLVSCITYAWRVVLAGLHDLMLGGCRPFRAERERSDAETRPTILLQGRVAVSLPGLLETSVNEDLLCSRLPLAH